jgi:acyl-CoA thioesterase FadM
VDSDVRLLRALEMDDVTRIEVHSQTEPGDPELRLGVEILVGRGGQLLKAAAAEVRILFRQAGDRQGRGAPPPRELLPYQAAEIRRPAGGTPEIEPPSDANAFVWRTRIPYFYCHFTERIQHSGYVRILEEVVDLFLADRGISIQTLLAARDWIPVVAAARIEILREAFMEEELHTVFTVENIFKRMRYTARMDCYVEREGQRIHTATGRITHAYLRIADRGTGGSLAEFDEAVMVALAGRKGAA